MLKFTIPGKPVPQERPYVLGYRAFDRPKSVKAKRVVAQYAQIALQGLQTGLLGPKYVGSVSICLKAYGARANADLDNLYKLVTDAMQGIVYANDSQIERINAYKLHCEKGHERTEVEVTELL